MKHNVYPRISKTSGEQDGLHQEFLHPLIWNMPFFKSYLGINSCSLTILLIKLFKSHSKTGDFSVKTAYEWLLPQNVTTS